MLSLAALKAIAAKRRQCIASQRRQAAAARMPETRRVAPSPDAMQWAGSMLRHADSAFAAIFDEQHCCAAVLGDGEAAR